MSLFSETSDVKIRFLGRQRETERDGHGFNHVRREHPIADDEVRQERDEIMSETWDGGNSFVRTQAGDVSADIR